ncbi:unnamed protein product [Cochlearia groenlandica]
MHNTGFQVVVHVGEKSFTILLQLQNIDQILIPYQGEGISLARHTSETMFIVQDDGLHFRQPWVFGVQEEVEKLKKKVKDLVKEIANLKELIAGPRT